MQLYRLIVLNSKCISINFDRLLFNNVKSISTNNFLLTKLKPQQGQQPKIPKTDENNRLKENQSTSGSNNAGKNESEYWEVLYRFKRIQTLWAMSRVKLYMTALSAVAVPYGLYSYATGGMAVNELYGLGGLTVVSLVGLYAFTYYTRRTVGVISRSTGTDTVRIGYLTFWGRRANVLVPYDDIVPFTDMVVKKDDLYVEIRRYSDPKFKLFLPKKDFEILNEDEFLRVFDSLLMAP